MDGPDAHSILRAFYQELRRLGYFEGQNLIVERYSAEGHRDRLAQLAEDVVRSKPDLIVTAGGPSARALKSATATIPIVASVGDPVVYGIAASVAHPGGNITGVSPDAGLETWGKRLALLKEIIPTLSKAGFLASRSQWEFPQGGGEATRGVARKLGIELVGAAVDEPMHDADYRRAFAAMSQDRVQALVVRDEPENLTNRRVIVELAEAARLPAIYPFRDHFDLGGLIAYAVDFLDLWRHLAQQVDQILKGTKPGEIPFFLATKFELRINLKAAKALGLTIPPSILAVADEVIE
jgi:putative ABC transport system substrate-binding protein